MKRLLYLLCAVLLITACSSNDSSECDSYDNYTASGDCRPVDTMTNDEIQQELEDIISNSLDE